MRRFGSYLEDTISKPFTREEAEAIADEVLTWPEDEQAEQVRLVLCEAIENVEHVLALMDETLVWYETHLMTKSAFLRRLGHVYPSDCIDDAYVQLMAALVKLDAL